MDAGQKLAQASVLMEQFAGATGLIGTDVQSRRYLWTDAFAVCNFLELFRCTGERRYRDLAVTLADAVHGVLGRHRPDDGRSGWISGLDEAEGAAHPLAGGLRIGKALPERPPGAPYDERAEWDRDGQYYHYLTKWMHALKRMSVVLGEASYSDHAIELARAAHRAFLQRRSPDQQAGLAWKMSIDLSHALVPFSGHHDPLDGLITYREVAGSSADLAAESDALAGLCEGANWATDDPLGIGGLLFDAGRLVQLGARGRQARGPLLIDVLQGALAGLAAFERSGGLQYPPERRLAFRELGLSIGLHALDGVLARVPLDAPARTLVAELRSFRSFADTIEGCWLEPGHRMTSAWRDHEDINGVMLATSLLPNGFLEL